MKRIFLLVGNILLVISLLLPMSGVAQPAATPVIEQVETPETVTVDSTESDFATITPGTSPDVTEEISTPQPETEGSTESPSVLLPAGTDEGTPSSPVASPTPATNSDLDTSIQAVDAPEITLSHSIGPAGAKITITGEHFDPDEAVPIWWNDTNDVTGFWMGTAGTLADGGFEMTTHTPAWATPGIYTIYAVSENGNTDNAQFEITADSVSANPTEGDRGTSVTITGEGLLSGDEFSIHWNSIFEGAIASGLVDRDGNFSATFQVPNDAVIGPATIYVKAGGLQFDLGFEVTTPITITVSPTSGSPGDQITVSGTHFVPGELVNIRWGSPDGEIVGYKNAEVDGTISGEILVPQSASVGVANIFLQSDSGKVSQEFTVTAAPASTISISPMSGVQGDRVSVSGANFPPNELVNFRWGSADGEILGYKNATSSGTISGAILVPASASAGSTLIYLQSGSTTASGSFTVAAPPAPTISISPTSGIPGDRVAVSGTNFPPSERVNFRWGSADGDILGYKNATSSGTISGAILVPANASAGSTLIYLQSGAVTASGTFTVTDPTISISPTSGVQGDRVAVSGANFPPSERVNFRWGSANGEILGYKNATSSGTISGAILVPANASAGSTLIYLQSGSVSASGSFMVTSPPSPTISISPTSGVQGDRVAVSGTNFPPNQRVNFRWGGADGEILGYKNATLSGTISGAILVPANASAGSTLIYLQSGSTTTSGSFTVTAPPSPTISISPTSGVQGDRVSVSGTNFPPGERVNFRWGSADGEILGYKNATSSGSISGAVLVPDGASAGSMPIYLQSGTATASGTFTVIAPPTPTISISPTSGVQGDRVSVSGTNFPPGERVNFRWGSANGEILGYKNATSSGTISGAILVPNGVSEGSVRIYLQSGATTASGTFTVEAFRLADVEIFTNADGTFGTTVKLPSWLQGDITLSSVGVNSGRGAEWDMSIESSARDRDVPMHHRAERTPVFGRV